MRPLSKMDGVQKCLLGCVFLFFFLEKVSFGQTGLCGGRFRNRTYLCKQFSELLEDEPGWYKGFDEPEFSCDGRCDKLYERRIGWKSCYCDAKCRSLGDCCVDYSFWCNETETNKTTLDCFAPHSMQGTVMIPSCPATWQNKTVKKLCLKRNKTKPLSFVPVYGVYTGFSYSNVYCAFCNKVNYFSYWYVKVQFVSEFEKALAERDDVSQTNLMKEHKWSPALPSNFSREFCIANTRVSKQSQASCRTTATDNLVFLCKAYSMPVWDSLAGKMFKNPHCKKMSCPLKNVLYGRVKVIRFSNSTAWRPGPDPPISIDNLFPFSCGLRKFFGSSDRCSVSPAPPTKTIVISNTSCLRWTSYNALEYVMYVNKSVLVSSLGKMFDPGSYKSINNTIHVCQNTSGFNPTKRDAVSSLIIYVCSAISMSSLVFFLLTNCLFHELHTVHFKNLMCLSVALLMFHCLFVASNKVKVRAVCDVITGLLHYALLAIFTWMSVVGYDVSKRFASKGGSHVRRNATRERKQFLRYCAFAWGLPLADVIVGVTLDVTQVVEIGYGQAKPQICYLSSTGYEYLVAFPVAVLLLFNIVALARTVVGIWAVQKDTKRVTGRNHQTSLVILSFKLTTVMGIMWISAFINGLTNNLYVRYINNVIVTLQGFFIVICFGCSKRIRDLYMKKLFRWNQSTEIGNIPTCHVLR